jgi:hypothetical protein
MNTNQSRLVKDIENAIIMRFCVILYVPPLTPPVMLSEVEAQGENLLIRFSLYRKT